MRPRLTLDIRIVFYKGIVIPYNFFLADRLNLNASLVPFCPSIIYTFNKYA